MSTDTPPTKEGKGGSSGSTRGERTPVTEDALMAALAALPPEKWAAAVNARNAPQGPSTPKLSAALEAIPPENAERVVEALHGATENLKARDAEMAAAMKERRPAKLTDAMKEPLADVDRVAPGLKYSLEANSSYRGKPIQHSIDQALRWLGERHGDQTATKGPRH